MIYINFLLTQQVLTLTTVAMLAQTNVILSTTVLISWKINRYTISRE